MNSDFKELLRRFNAAEVRYLVVGGYAVMKYTEPRYTKDLDIRVEATPDNSRAVFDALKGFGAPLANVTEGDFATEGLVYQMGRPPARIDILMSIAGVRFLDAWANHVVSNFDGVPGNVISLKDLIANKQAAGRPQDSIDVANLLEAERIARRATNPPTTPKKKRPGRRDADSGRGE